MYMCIPVCIYLYKQPYFQCENMALDCFIYFAFYRVPTVFYGDIYLISGTVENVEMQ